MSVTVKVNSGGTTAWNNEIGELESSPVTISGVGDRAVTTIDQLATQSGNWIVQVDGGDPVTVGGAFTKSIAVAKAIIASRGARPRYFARHLCLNNHSSHIRIGASCASEPDWTGYRPYDPG